MALPATRPTAATSSGVVLSADQLLEIYYYLRLTRTLEERLVALYRQTKVIGGLFRSLGQEGESVASAYALERGRHKDILSPLIRNLGSLLVMGAQPLEILRQYMAKADSPTHGRELNVHFNDLEKGYLGQISHLGDMIPVMAGIALTFKLRGEARVGLVYIGDEPDARLAAQLERQRDPCHHGDHVAQMGDLAEVALFEVVEVHIELAAAGRAVGLGH